MDLLAESPQSAASGASQPNALAAWLRAKVKSIQGESPWEFVVLIVMTSFLLFYGLIPLFGGDQVGLAGADEPRYTQIGRELLKSDTKICGQLNTEIIPRSLRAPALENSFRCLDAGTVTPILYGHPWLDRKSVV